MNEKTVNLVDKLREYAVEPGRYWLDNYALQAGHEIERLRREIEGLETRLQTLTDKYIGLESERNQWQSLAERFSKFSSNSGLASSLFAEIDDLLAK